MNSGQEVLQIPLNQITPNQFQPRTNFDDKELQELAASIKEHGIIQPLVLRKMGQNYEIIAGERRYRASKILGLETVPAIISNIDDQTSAEVALVENVQRKDLTAIEEARSYKNILDKGYLTQEQLAKKMGVSQPAIANKLRLLNLDDSVQQALLDGKISERHARSLLGVESKEKQKEWLDKIISQRLTVRQLDLAIKKEQESTPNSFISIVEDVKKNATDIPPVNVNNNNNNTFNNNAVNNEPKKEEQPKPQNRFFNFLEEESANMDTTEEPSSIFNSSPVINNEEVAPSSENKFINFNSIPETEEPPVEEEQPKPEKTEDDEPQIETLFDPMDQVDYLDPDYEKKQQEQMGLDLKTAINETRTEIEKLQEKGFKLEVDEVDLEDKYQITISIEK